MWVTLLHGITACSCLGKDVGRGECVIFANRIACVKVSDGVHISYV